MCVILDILSPKSRPFMSTTTFTIKANNWAPSTTFDGQSITYTITQTDHVPESPAVTFPGQTGSNSPWLTNTIYPQGVAIIFGKIVNSGDSGQIWQWLAPSVSGSDLTFTVSDTAGDDDTVVYVFTIGTNHGQVVAYSPFAIAKFGTGGSVTRTSIIYYGPYKAGTIQWGEYLENMLPKITKQYFVYDSSNTDVSPDNNPFIPEVSTQSLNVMILSSINSTINNELSESDTVIIFMIDQNSLTLSVRSSTIFNVYRISTDGYNTTTLNSHVSYKADMNITNNSAYINTLTVNDFIATNRSPKITGTVIYNRAIDAIGSLPIPHVSSLQMVQTNLQTIYDRLGGAMVEAQGYGTTRQYFAAGDFADRIWERFDTTINRLIIDGTIGTTTAAIADQLDTIFRAYIITVPSDSSDAKAIIVVLNGKTYSLYIEHEGAYHAVMSSQDGITVDGVSGGATWDTLTGGDIVINGKLFYNNVSQLIVTDWTTDELLSVTGASINTKTAVIVGRKKYPLITFKNISPSLIWINENDGVE